MMKSLRGSLSFILFLIVAIFFLPSQSFAHAYIVKSNPSENEVLTTSPTKITIQFDEAIEQRFYSMKVTDQSGKRVDQKDAKISQENQAILEETLEPDLPNGTYLIQWKVVSSDGHPINGTIPFQIGKDAKHTKQVKESTSGYLPQPDMISLRGLLYISFSLFLGILFFTSFIVKSPNLESLRKRTKWLLTGSYIGLGISILLGLPLQIHIEAEVAWSKAFDPSFIMQILEYTTFGLIWMIQVILFLLLSITYFLYSYRQVKRKKVWELLSIVFVSGLILTKAFIGHSATGQNILLSITMDFFHLGAAALWLGSLIALVFFLTNYKEEKTFKWETIRRFSGWSILFVSILLLTGIYGSLLYVPTWNALFHTSYGQVLLVKAALFIVMLGFGAVHFLRGKRKKGSWGTSIWLEFFIGLVILVLAAILTNLPTALDAPGVFNQTAKTKEGYTVSLKIDPNVVGTNLFTVKLFENGKELTNIDQVTITLTCLDMDMGKTTIQLSKEDMRNKKQAKGVISMAGSWKAHVHGLTASLDEIDADFTFMTGNQ